MSKAILVLDMHSSCSECCFCRGLNVCRLKQCLEKDGILSAFTVDKQIMDNSKPDWCPLKKLPKKRELKGDMTNIVKMGEELINVGYNACIDEILKGSAIDG